MFVTSLLAYPSSLWRCSWCGQQLQADHASDTSAVHCKPFSHQNSADMQQMPCSPGHGAEACCGLHLLYNLSARGVAVGLVYKHYGHEVVARLAKLPADHPDVETVYLQVGAC